MAYLFNGEPIFEYPLSDLSFTAVELLDIVFSIDSDRCKFSIINTFTRPEDIESIGFFIEEPHKIVVRSSRGFSYVTVHDFSIKYSIVGVHEENEGGYQSVLNFRRLIKCTPYTMKDVIRAVKREHEHEPINLHYFNVKRNLSTYHKKFEEHELKITRRTTLRKFLKDNGAKWSRNCRKWFIDSNNRNGVVANIFCPDLP